MGRLKTFERQKARERERENIGVRMPLMCAAAGCSAATEIGWLGPGPFPAALFFQAGWMARSDPSDGITRFYCPSCWPNARDEPVGLLDDNGDEPTSGVRSQVFG